MRPKTNEEIEREVELGGTPRTSPLFPIHVRAEKVTRCQDVKGVSACEPCPFYEHCTLAHERNNDLVEEPKIVASLAAKAEAVGNPWLKLDG